MKNASEKAHTFPKLELQLESIDKNKVIDLKNFEIAFMTLFGLTTAWLPFIRLSSGYETQQALEIKQFIYETYAKVSLISERFHHLENVYLTEFTYTQNFHQKWFSEVFSIVIDILSGGEFIIWQFSLLVVKLEKLIAKRKKELDNIGDDKDQEIYTLNDLILIPILKSAFLFSQNSTLTSINEEIEQKLAQYLSSEDLQEWNEFYQDYTFENLILFVLSELVQLLRKKFLMSISKLRVYTGIVLDVLQILIDIKDVQYYDKYLSYKSQILRFITTRDSRFLSLKVIFPLEFEILNDVNKINNIEGDLLFTKEEASEFLHLMRFFALPKLNWILDLASRFARIVKLNLLHTEGNNFDVEVIALTSFTLIKDLNGEINKDFPQPGT